MKQNLEKYHDLFILLPVLAAGLLFFLSVLWKEMKSSDSASETWYTVATDEANTNTEWILQTTLEEIHNLNLATESDLQRVKGIGPVLSKRIVEYRKTHGAFRRRAELLEIPGITEALLERMMTEFEIPDEQPPETTLTTTLTMTSTTTIPTTAATAPKTQKSGKATKATTATTVSQPVGYYDLNVVTKEELMRIPGMDETMAEQVLLLREKIHHFSSIYELNMIEDFTGKYIKQTCMQYLYVENDPVTAGQTTAQTVG